MIDNSNVIVSTDVKNEAQIEVLGDKRKIIPLDTDRVNIKHVCIISIDTNYTIEVVHGNNSASSQKDSNQSPSVTIYPHDTEEVLKDLDPTIEIQTIYLTPNVRRSIAAIRRLKHDIDIFINLYDNSDDTAMKIIEYMETEGIAFTGCGAQFCDPTRVELKRLCRYLQLSSPNFALLSQIDDQENDELNDLVEKLGGFPLFVKPEHGYDSKLFCLRV